jgi:hypothetical protein
MAVLVAGGMCCAKGAMLPDCCVLAIFFLGEGEFLVAIAVGMYLRLPVIFLGQGLVALRIYLEAMLPVCVRL